MTTGGYLKLKKLTKIIAFGLALCLAAVLFAACNSKSSTEETSNASTGSEEPTVSYPTVEKLLLYKTSGPTGEWTIYEYDEWGILSATEDSEGLRKSYTYTEWGELSAIESNDGTRIDYTYDEQNRPARVDAKTRNGGIQYAQKWEYDEEGRVARFTHYDGSTTTTEYTYDDDGKLIKTVETNGITTYTTEYTYDEDGNYSTSYDTADQHIVWYYNAKGDILAKYADDEKVIQYTYDDNGNLLKFEGYYEGEVVEYEEYAYDAEGKLTEKSYESDVSWVDSYTYDELGNCIQIKRIGKSGAEQIIEENEYKSFAVRTE